MKSILTICTILLSYSTFISCKKEVKDEEMTIVRDCSGTYLRFDDKDYAVCNLSKTESFENGETVTASFRRIEDCKEQEGRSVCLLYHENEGLIKVIRIE